MAGSVKSGDDDLVTDINIVPLVDVILVLLIVFMITMPTIVGVAQIKVDLPQSEMAAVNAEALPLHFSVRRNSAGEAQLFVEDRPTNADGLRDLVKNIIPEATEVSLAAERGIPYGEIIRYMDLMGSLGLHKIALDTKHSN